MAADEIVDDAPREMQRPDLQVTPSATKTHKMLDETIDFMHLVEWLADGKGYRAFAKEHCKCSYYPLFIWSRATPERRAMIDAAQDAIAESYIEIAEKHLLDIDVTDTDTASAAIARARHLDNHYRWKASKHGRKYSDSIKLQGDKDNPFSVSMTVEKIERVIVDPKAAPQT